MSDLIRIRELLGQANNDEDWDDELAMEIDELDEQGRFVPLVSPNPAQPNPAQPNPVQPNPVQPVIQPSQLPPADQIATILAMNQQSLGAQPVPVAGEPGIAPVYPAEEKKLTTDEMLDRLFEDVMDETNESFFDPATTRRLSF